MQSILIDVQYLLLFDDLSLGVVTLLSLAPAAVMTYLLLFDDLSLGVVTLLSLQPQ